MNKDYETQIKDVEQKIAKLQAHVAYLKELKRLRDESPPSQRNHPTKED